MKGKLALILLVCAVSLPGCTAIEALHQMHQQEDADFCQSNGYQPGTELYLECLNMAETQRLNASQALTQQGLREMSGQP